MRAIISKSSLRGSIVGWIRCAFHRNPPFIGGLRRTARLIHPTKLVIMVLMFLFISPTPASAKSYYDDVPLLVAPIHPDDQASLQRGAKIYINYCAGCHSLKFMRYNRLAKDAGIVDEQGQVDVQMLKEDLIFTGAGVADSLQVAMPAQNAKSWFGVTPPDLSLIGRSRGADWLYTYLLSFYQDKSRPLGVNNLLFNETAMPDVLVNLRGVQIPVYSSQDAHTIDYLLLQTPGSMTPHQFDAAVADLVNFLVYVGEPARHDRISLGFWVLGFLIIFVILTYLLKQAYWSRVD